MGDAKLENVSKMHSAVDILHAIQLTIKEILTPVYLATTDVNLILD